MMLKLGASRATNQPAIPAAQIISRRTSQFNIRETPCESSPFIPLEVEDSRGLDKSQQKLNGVVVTQVDANSEAAGRGIMSGDVVLQTNQDVVSTPDDMVRNVDSATKDGHQTILLLLSNARRDTQSVSLSL
jgi:S1-C subfamily serine protease